MFNTTKTTIEVQVCQVTYFTGLVWFQVQVNGTTASEAPSEEQAWRQAVKLANRLKGELQLDMKLAA